MKPSDIIAANAIAPELTAGIRDDAIKKPAAARPMPE